MLFCMSGLTIWMNRETGRSQGTRWMITPGEAKVGFSKVLKDFFFSVNRTQLVIWTSVWLNSTSCQTSKRLLITTKRKTLKSIISNHLASAQSSITTMARPRIGSLPSQWISRRYQRITMLQPESYISKWRAWWPKWWRIYMPGVAIQCGPEIMYIILVLEQENAREIAQ